MGEQAEDERLLLGLLEAEPEAQARYLALKEYKRQMCLRWIAAAGQAELREGRARRLVRGLWLTVFDPYYDLGPLTLSELEDLYGPPKQLIRLPAAAQVAALREARVLGAYHYRNFDDGGTTFYIVSADTTRFDEFMLVYDPPCRLTNEIVGWLDRNNIETVREMRDYLLPAEE